MMIGGIGFWVTGATFNSLSVISWRSVLLVEKTGVHRGGGGLFSITNRRQNLSNNDVSSTPRHAR